MGAIGRFLHWLFIEPFQFALAWAYVIVVVFIYAGQRFFAPYTSPDESRVKALQQELLKHLQKSQGKSTVN